MIETVNELLNMHREAFNRDQAICENLYKSHFLPAGSGLNVKPETHLILKDFKTKVIDIGFKPPSLPIYNKDFLMHDVDLSFHGSDLLKGS